MKLILVRHGDAVAESINPERPLSEQGWAETVKIARIFHKSGVAVDAIYHSTKKRAAQTAEIMRDILNPKIILQQKHYLSPNDPTDQICEDIKGWEDNTMIVGHLPFLPELVSRLVTGSEGQDLVAMPTSAIVVLESEDHKRWSIIAQYNPRLIAE